MKDLRLYVYCVGHGVCTLLHGTKEDSSSYNAVFDCGYQPLCSSAEYNGFVIDSNYLDQVLKTMAGIILQNGNDHLDLLVCSHQDIDHNNLFVKLLSFLNCWGEPINKDHWLRSGENSIVNGYTKDFKKITYESGSQRTVYEYEDHFFGSNNVKITQSIIPLDDNTMFNELCANAINNNSSLAGFPNSPVFTLTIEAKITQDKNAKESVVQHTVIKGSISLNSDYFEDTWKSKEYEGKVFSCWYDNDISDFFKKFSFNFKKACGEPMADRLLSQFRSWLNILGAQYFKVPDVMYDSRTICCFMSQINNLRWASFKLDSVIMGGFSRGEEYNLLKNFMYKYSTHMVPGGAFRTCNHYKYLDVSFDGPLEPGWNCYEGIVSTADISDIYNTESSSVLYNATSLVVNFTYYTRAGKCNSILFPGDVTVHNQQDVALRLKDSGADCLFVIAPHHGSFKSNFFLDKDSKKRGDITQNLPFLYSAMGKGVTTIISECLRNFNYFTPRREYCEIALDYSPIDPRTHEICMFNGDSVGAYNSIMIERGVYLTGVSFCSESQDLMCFEPQIDAMESQSETPRLPNDRQSRLPSIELFV